MDLSFLCFDNSLELGVFCFLIVEFLFELLDFSFKLVENDGLDTLELKSVKPNEYFQRIIIDITDDEIALEQKVLKNIKRKLRIRVDGTRVQCLG